MTIAATLIAVALGLPGLTRDVEVLRRPTAAGLLTGAADVAGIIPTPHARAAAIGFAALAIMARFPSGNPITDAQTSLRRGGRLR